MGIMAKAGSFFPKTTWRDTVVSRIWMGWPRTKQRQKRSPHSNKWAAAAGSTNSLGLLTGSSIQELENRCDIQAPHQEEAMLLVGLVSTHRSTLKAQRRAEYKTSIGWCGVGGHVS